MHIGPKMKLCRKIPYFKYNNTLYCPKSDAFIATTGMFIKNQSDNDVLLLIFKKSFF